MKTVQPGDRVRIIGIGDNDAYSDTPELVGVTGTVGDFVTTWPDGMVYTQVTLDEPLNVEGRPPLVAPIFYRATLAHVEAA